MPNNKDLLSNLYSDSSIPKSRILSLTIVSLAIGFGIVLYNYWQLITSTLLLIFALISALVVGFSTIAILFGVMASFTSRSQEYNTSIGALFITRAIVAIPLGVIAGIFTFALILRPSTTGPSDNLDSKISLPATKAEIISKSDEARQSNNSASSPSESSKITEDGTTQNQVNPVAKNPKEVSSQPASGSNLVEKIYSDEEISRMEDEKQYHGSDPLIRKRLGLPLRDSQSTNSQPN